MEWGDMLTIPYSLFPTTLGLDDDSGDFVKPIMLSEGGIDPRTGGAVVVTSETSVDTKKNELKLSIDYWRMRPNGEQLKHNLFDIEFANIAQAQAMAPKSIWVMGRRFYDASASEDNTVGLPSGSVRNINRVLSAVQFIHRDIREGRLPQIAKIFKDAGIQESVGERLPIVGLSPTGGFDFNIYEQFAASPEISRIPSEIVNPLLGMGENTLDLHQRLGKGRLTTAVDPRHGTMFATDVKIAEEVAHTNVTMRIDPINTPDDKHAYAIPDLAAIKWNLEQDHSSVLGALDFLGVDVMKADHSTRMKVIGVINKIMHDVRRRDYPSAIDHLTEFDMHDWAETTDKPPARGRLIIESRGGNNMEEIADGYGNQINGNCKHILVEWLDENGQPDSMGTVHDLGIFLPAKDIPNQHAAPDIVNLLKKATHLFFTHRHLDHTDGAIAYIAKGYFRGKVIHASAECIRSLRQKLQTYEIPKEFYPTFAPLKSGVNWLHFKDKKGITRLSVGYSTDGTPHTARCTPFIYVARNGSEVLGSYLNHGDARFGVHNMESYKGYQPDADYLDKEFFSNWAQSLIKDDPSVEASIRGRRATLADVDTTGVRQKGSSATNWQTEGNTGELLQCDYFKDKGIVSALISTSETGIESSYRIASVEGRDVTEFGANIEHTATTANVMGLNKLRVAPQERQNIQLYLDHIYLQRSNAAIEALSARLETEKKRGARKEIEREINVELEIQKHFLDLKEMRHPYKRYRLRKKLEARLQRQYGTFRSLGAIRVTRNTQTSKEIFESSPKRRYIIVTGTQGNFVEIDATLYKLSEGRSLFDFKTEVMHTARPLRPSQNVILISQSAIPGNERKQRELVNRLTSRGFTVVVAVRNGFEIHNLKEKHRVQIVSELKAKGREVEIQQDGTVAVYNMPIHASGHGYEDDTKAWLKLIEPDFAAPQHTADPQAVQRFAELAEEGGHRHAGRIFENFERILVEMGPTAAESVIKTIGRSIPSIILVEIVRKARQYHGGHIEATRVVKLDGEGGLRPDGLMASSKPDGLYRTHFATVVGEVARRKAAAKEATRPSPEPYNRTPPLLERRYEGPQRPGAHRQQLPLQPGQRLSALAA